MNQESAKLIPSTHHGIKSKITTERLKIMKYHSKDFGKPLKLLLKNSLMLSKKERLNWKIQKTKDRMLKG